MKFLFIYSVDVFDFDSEVYFTQFGLVDNKEDAADFVDHEYMKDFKIVGEISIEKVIAAIHCFGKDELKKRYPFEYAK